MRRLVFSPAAQRDLIAIVGYVAVASGSIRVARMFVTRLRGRCIHLASLPGTLGIARPEIGNDVRTVAERGYLITFRYQPGQVRILRVIEGHRDRQGWSDEDEV